MSNLVTFENADNESNILRIGGKSFLPPDMEWPTNPNGEKMVFIFNIPTNFLNAELILIIRKIRLFLYLPHIIEKIIFWTQSFIMGIPRNFRI